MRILSTAQPKVVGAQLLAWVAHQLIKSEKCMCTHKVVQQTEECMYYQQQGIRSLCSGGISSTCLVEKVMCILSHSKLIVYSSVELPQVSGLYLEQTVPFWAASGEHYQKMLKPKQCESCLCLKVKMFGRYISR